MPRERLYKFVRKTGSCWQDIDDKTYTTAELKRQLYTKSESPYKGENVRFMLAGYREKANSPGRQGKRETTPEPAAVEAFRPKWRRCPAGHSFPSEAVVMYEEGPQRGEPRLSRTAIWGCRYILVSELLKLETEK